MSNSSTEVNEIAAALAKAQISITGAIKDSTNPHFKSSYADLASVWDACHAALNEQGIAIVQATSCDERGIVLATRLIHASGQWLSSEYPVRPTQDTPQGYGSALTYARRYSLMCMTGVAGRDDDDGNAATIPAAFAALPQELFQSKPKSAPQASAPLPPKEIPPVPDVVAFFPDFFASGQFKRFKPAAGVLFTSMKTEDLEEIISVVQDAKPTIHSDKAKSWANAIEAACTDIMRDRAVDTFISPPMTTR